MWPYWLIFLVPALASLQNPRVKAAQKAARPVALKRFNLTGAWWMVVVALTLLIGYRYEVGGDWGSFLRHFEDLRYDTLSEALSEGDPGYQLIQWVSMQLDWEIYGVNLIGGGLFTLGLVVFCRNLPRPWLALSVAVPYMVLVVSMGYTRQGIAIGLAMLGMVALGRASVRQFVFWTLLAATFHKSAVLLLPIAALASTKKRIWTAIWIAVVAAGAYLVLLEKSADVLYLNYIVAEYESQGALIRLLMNVVPAIILLFWKRKFEMTLPQMRLWLWISVLSLALLIVYFLTPASTAVDRVALYMLPLQVTVFSYVPEVFGGRRARNTIFIVAVLLYYAVVLYVWLNYAIHAQYWVPYQNWLLL